MLGQTIKREGRLARQAKAPKRMDHIPELPLWKPKGKRKVSLAANDLQSSGDYDVSMVERIGPKKPRQRAHLRAWREHFGLSGEQLADRIGTTKATISRYETGKRAYPGGFLAAVAEALAINEADLFRLPDNPSLDEMVKNAPESVRKRIVAVVEALLKEAS